MLPAREFPEEDPSRTGRESAPGPPAAPPSPADADEAATADGAGVAYDPPQPARAGAPEDAASPAETGPSVKAVTWNQWSDILAMFVDDPRGSVAEASVMVDEAVEALIASARERQASLATSWQAADADTEQLRVALQEYRMFWDTVARLPQPA